MIATLFSITSLVVIFAALALLAVSSLRQYLKLRGPRVVTCPFDKTEAAVEVDALLAALASLESPSLRLKSCTHWPERGLCGQECLREIETSPDGCLVREKLANWYMGKSCVLCGKHFGEIDWMEHKPALMAADHCTKEWSQIRYEELHGILETHLPVCWNCHIAATFRRQYPDLVTDRPWKKLSH
jgi:hypothetical protein